MFKCIKATIEASRELGLSVDDSYTAKYAESKGLDNRQVGKKHSSCYWFKCKDDWKVFKTKKAAIKHSRELYFSVDDSCTAKYTKLKELYNGQVGKKYDSGHLFKYEDRNTFKSTKAAIEHSREYGLSADESCTAKHAKSKLGLSADDSCATEYAKLKGSHVRWLVSNITVVTSSSVKIGKYSHS